MSVARLVYSIAGPERCIDVEKGGHVVAPRSVFDCESDVDSLRG